MVKKFFMCLVFVLLFAPFSIAEMPKKEISIIAKQYEFIPNKIEVEKGMPVKLYLTSVDVDHGIFIDAFKVNQKIEKGKVSVVEFTPNKTGEFEIGCSVFCGSGHMGMKGRLIVKEMKHDMDMEHKTMNMNSMGKSCDMH